MSGLDSRLADIDVPDAYYCHADHKGNHEGGNLRMVGQMVLAKPKSHAPRPAAVAIRVAAGKAMTELSDRGVRLPNIELEPFGDAAPGGPLILE